MGKKTYKLPSNTEIANIIAHLPRKPFITEDKKSVVTQQFTLRGEEIQGMINSGHLDKNIIPDNGKLEPRKKYLLKVPLMRDPHQTLKRFLKKGGNLVEVPQFWNSLPDRIDKVPL